jgi:hypothetical protein
MGAEDKAGYIQVTGIPQASKRIFAKKMTEMLRLWMVDRSLLKIRYLKVIAPAV